MPAAPPLFSETEEIPQWEDTTEIVDERPPERESATFVEPPVAGPVEGLGAEDIPPGMSAGLPPRPTEAQWEQARKQSKLGEEVAGTMAEADIVGNAERAINLAQDGLISPRVAEMALAVGAPAMPPGIRRSLAEAGSGLTSPVNAGLMLATGAGSAIPKIGGAVARGVAGGFAADIAAHMPELGTAAGEASVTGTPEEQQKAFTDVGLSALMGGLAGAGTLHRAAPARPAIPPQFIETMRRVDAVVPDALQRSKEAAVKKVSESVAKLIEVEAKVEPMAGERPGGTPPREAPPSPADMLAADVTREQAIAAEKKALLDSEDIMTLGENPKWMELSKEFEDIKNRYQGRKPSDVVVEQTTTKSAQVSSKLVVPESAEPLTRGGNKITSETQPERIVVQAEQDLGGGETMPGYVTIQSKGNAQSGPVEAWRAAGHEIPDTAGLLSGTYTVAELKARANEKVIPATTEAATPTAANQTSIPARQAPVVEPGVGAVPGNISGAEPSAPGAGRVEPTAVAKPGTSKVIRRSDYKTEQEWADAVAETDRWASDPNQFYNRSSPSLYEPWTASVLQVVPLDRGFAVEYAGQRVGYGKTEAAAIKAAEVTHEEFRGKPLQLSPATKSTATTVPRTGSPSLEEIGNRPGESISSTQPFFERESEAAGLGRSSLPPTVADVRAQRARDAATPDTIETQAVDPASGAPVPAKVPDTAGTNVKMRKSAERATTSPMFPKQVQERIETAPESRFRQQTDAKVDDAVKSMTDAELAAMPAESNLFVASRLEQADRLLQNGELDAGYQVFVNLEKQGTSFGQNVNQFKRLKGTRPEYVAVLLDKKLTAAGKDPLTPAQRTQAIETTRKAKAADLALDKSTDAWTKNPTAENAAKAEAALDKANAEAVELQKFVAKFEPRSTSGVLKSVLQGNLLTPISEVANLFGNMSFLPFRALDRAVGTGLDIIDSAVRGKPRELSVQPLAGTAEALKGVGRGLKQIPDILIEGTGNVIKGETRAGLHPIKAWINQFAKNPEMPTTGGKLTLKDRLNLAIEGTFGVPAEAMLRGLGAGDVPFKEGARARVTAEQLKLNDVPRDQWGFAQKFPELFLPKEALQQIHKDTMAAVFQRESKTLNLMTNWLKGKGEVLDFVAATVAPYKLTPWNIVGEILSYNPLIAMARGANDARLGNTRAAKLNAGKMVVGSMLTGTGIWLYKNGLLAPSLDERDEAQKARVLSGKVLPPNHINISGLKRATSGGDPSFKAGDETVDVFRAGGLAGAMFYMTANIGRDMERGPSATDGDMWMNIIRQSTLEQARFGLNQSFLSGVDGLLTAIKEGNADNYLRQWANTVGSIVLPNTLNTISRSMRKYQVDTKADDFKDKIGNMVKTKLGFAGLDDYLPLKRDFWGKPMLETPEGRDAIFYHFFDISKNKQVTSDPVELELYRLWRKTGDTAVIPSLPQRDVTFARTGYALNPQQYERYAELVGENRRNIVDALAVNPQFHKLDDEQKIKLLERVYRDGMERGKALFYREFNGQLTPKQGRAGFPP